MITDFDRVEVEEEGEDYDDGADKGWNKAGPLAKWPEKVTGALTTNT